MRIILLSGNAGTGKSTIAKLIKESPRTSRCRIFPFAEHLKDIAKKLGWEGSKHPTEPYGRQFLVDLGLLVRKQDPDFWANKVVGKIMTDHPANSFSESVYIIDDWRYPNEFKVLRDAFGDSVYPIFLSREGVIPLDNEAEKHYGELRQQAKVITLEDRAFYGSANMVMREVGLM